MGNLVICNSKLSETITLAITIGDWGYPRMRVNGKVVDSIVEHPEKNNYNYFLRISKNLTPN